MKQVAPKDYAPEGTDVVEKDEISLSGEVSIIEHYKRYFPRNVLEWFFSDFFKNS